MLSVQTQKFLVLCVSDERMQPLTLHRIRRVHDICPREGCGDANETRRCLSHYYETDDKSVASK